MFRLEFLKLKGHPQLGDLHLDLIEKKEIKHGDKPYTTVIIGPNGTGKSFILRTIAEIFRQFRSYYDSEKKDFNLPFSLYIRYHLDDNIYEIVSRKLTIISRKKPGRNYNYYKNRPLNIAFNKTDSPSEIKTGYEISFKELKFPASLLVNSVIPTDRFIRKISNKGDFYQYLGARSTSSTTSTKSSIRRTIKHIFNATAENDIFIESLKDLLSFLEFDESLKVAYRTKINKLFFSNNLNTENFKMYFENWWDEKFEYSKRKKENPLWSIPYYNSNFRNNEDHIIRIVNYLRELSNNPHRLKNKPRSSSKIIEIDLFDPNISEYDLAMISHLESLDIINLEGIRFQKEKVRLSVDSISSGEYHLLISLIGIFANIKENSLVLIDEPEISLHPNWQMRYVSFLKKVFEYFTSCHFILTTHSHFLISDLEGANSCVVALNKNENSKEIYAKLLEGANTFGWSAEQVLLEVFNVTTTRNYFIADRIGEILELISKKERNENLVREKVTSLINKNVFDLSHNDPLKLVWNKIVKKYG